MNRNPTQSHHLFHIWQYYYITLPLPTQQNFYFVAFAGFRGNTGCFHPANPSLFRSALGFASCRAIAFQSQQNIGFVSLGCCSFPYEQSFPIKWWNTAFFFWFFQKEISLLVPTHVFLSPVLLRFDFPIHLQIPSLLLQSITLKYNHIQNPFRR